MNKLANFSAADASRLLAGPSLTSKTPSTADTEVYDPVTGKTRYFRAEWNPATGRYDQDRHEISRLGVRLSPVLS